MESKDREDRSKAIAMYEELTGCGGSSDKSSADIRWQQDISLDKENVEKFKRRLNDQCTLQKKS